MYFFWRQHQSLQHLLPLVHAAWSLHIVCHDCKGFAGWWSSFSPRRTGLLLYWHICSSWVDIPCPSTRVLLPLLHCCWRHLPRLVFYFAAARTCCCGRGPGFFPTARSFPHRFDRSLSFPPLRLLVRCTHLVIFLSGSSPSTSSVSTLPNINSSSPSGAVSPRSLPLLRACRGWAAGCVGGG